MVICVTRQWFAKGSRTAIRRLAFGAAVAFLVGLSPLSGQAQTPTAPDQPGDPDAPSIRLGATLFTQYAYQAEPLITDADGNVVHRSAFDVTRTYININGTISHVIGFRVTPDIARETNLASSLSGSLELRIKYAYLQANLDDWTTKGTWARFGMHQTPYIDFVENIYRYRFQGTTFLERTGYASSSDAGVSFHYNLPGDRGDVHVGLYNGENYNHPETNDQKAIMVRGTVRPFAAPGTAMYGLRMSVFYSGDNYLRHGERKRTVFLTSYEHPHVVAGFEFADTHDRSSALPGTVSVHGQGYSTWVTPRSGHGWEGLLRYDHMTPNTSNLLAPPASAGDASIVLRDQEQNRLIVGGAYWFPHHGTVSAALLVDEDWQTLHHLTSVPTRTVAVHALINF